MNYDIAGDENEKLISQQNGKFETSSPSPNGVTRNGEFFSTGSATPSDSDDEPDGEIFHDDDVTTRENGPEIEINSNLDILANENEQKV